MVHNEHNCLWNCTITLGWVLNNRGKLCCPIVPMSAGGLRSVIGPTKFITLCLHTVRTTSRRECITCAQSCSYLVQTGCKTQMRYGCPHGGCHPPPLPGSPKRPRPRPHCPATLPCPSPLPLHPIPHTPPPPAYPFAPPS